MKKLLSFTIMCILAFSMSSCAYFQGKVIPQAKQKAADSLTKAIVKTGECVAMDQVRLDVEKLFKIESNDSMVVKAMGSESSPEGAQEEGVVSEICKAAAKLAIPTLLSKGVPEKWDCRLTDMSSKVTELASKACGEIPI